MVGRWLKLSAFIVIFAMLGGCIETYKLDAIRPAPRPRYANDDRPRVDIARAEAKKSFVYFLASECPQDKLKVIAKAANDKDEADGPKQENSKLVVPAISSQVEKSESAKSQAAAAKNVTTSSLCVDRISAYAVDQCIWMTRNQNKAALTTSLLTSIATIGGATATNIAILAHPSSAGNSTAGLLGAAVVASSDKIKILTPTTVPLKDMLEVGTIYAKSIGLTDDDIPSLPPGGTKDEIEQFAKYVKGDADALSNFGMNAGIKKLARIHDAVLSTCTANAIGLGL